MTLQMLLLPGEFAMTLQMYLLPGKLGTTLQMRHLQGSIQESKERRKAKVGGESKLLFCFEYNLDSVYDIV